MVLEKFREAGLTINVEKSIFAKRELMFLGHILSEDGIKRNPEKVEAILEWPRPTDKQGVQKFTATCQWYSSFIKNFAEKADPLYDLLRGKKPWYWGPKQEKSFQQLKLDMANKVILMGLDYSLPIIIKCDASQVGLGAVLCQVIDGKERPVTFISKTLKKYERNAHIYEKEIYAIIWALDKLSQYVEGHPFIIHTDNRAVNYLHGMKSTKSKLMRWANEISRWNATIVLVPGKDNIEADALSRAPIPEKSTDRDIDQDADDIVYTPMACMCYDTPTWEKIQSEQRRDPDLLKIIKAIADPNSPMAKEYKGYFLQNDTLKKEIVMERKMVELLRGSREDEHGEGEHGGSRCGIHEDKQNAHTVEQVNVELENPAGGSRSEPRPHGSRRPGRKSTEPIPVEKTLKLVPVIPKSLIPEILKIFHDVPEAAHLGMRKTKQKIKDRCFWNFMNRDIQKYIHECHVCQVTKPVNQLPAGLLQSVEPPTAVFETIDVDFMGPFPASSKNQNRFLFVVIDELSKWVELIPMRAATAKKVAENLENQVFCRFGIPKNVLSDNGSQFTSKIMKKLCQQWRVTHKLISPYHPQANQSERTNKNLKAMIQAYVEENHRQWDFHLQKFAFALRTSINETTQVTPSLLNLGRELPVPFDRNLQEDEQADMEANREELKELPQKLQEIIAWVRTNIIKAQAVNKSHYDKSHRHVDYQIGELVLMKSHGKSEKHKGIIMKFNNRWNGPVKIHKKLTDVSYEIYNVHTNKPMGKRHVSELKPYFQRADKEEKTQKKPAFEFPTVKRSLRNTKRVNYRTLAGYRQSKTKN
jgi:transposase InsO family protein